MLARMRTHLARILSIAILASAPIANGFAQSPAAFPDRAIRIVVPFTPGGGNDVFARAVGQKMQERMGQPVIVENKPGAGGNIGAEFVAKSAADGYTLLVAQNGLTMVPWLQKNLNFDPMGFAPVLIALTLPMGAAVNNELPVRSIPELIEYAKANPNKLSFATPGIGTPHHLAMELFMDLTGTRMVMVPYKGAAGMLPDLMGGRVNVLFGALNSMLPHMQSGKIRAIGVGEKRRLAILPDVPTVAETIPGYEVPFWFGLVAPAGTPGAITRKIADEVKLIVNLPDTSKQLQAVGFEITPGTPEEMRATMQADHDRWGQVVKKAGIKME